MMGIMHDNMIYVTRWLDFPRSLLRQKHYMLLYIHSLLSFTFFPFPHWWMERWVLVTEPQCANPSTKTTPQARLLTLCSGATFHFLRQSLLIYHLTSTFAAIIYIMFSYYNTVHHCAIITMFRLLASISKNIQHLCDGQHCARKVKLNPTLTCTEGYPFLEPT